MPPALADFTTLRLGGPAARFVEAADEAAIVAAVRAADARGEPLLILAGGSNLVVADAGFPGTVLRIASRGVERGRRSARRRGRRAVGSVRRPLRRRRARRRRVPVGHPGLGRRDADPERRRLRPGGRRHDRLRARLRPRARARGRTIPAADCGFSYRSSVFKRTPGRWVVLAVTYALAAPGGVAADPLRRAGARARRRGGRAPRRSPTCARPCSRCAAARGWCSTRPTRTRSRPARSSPTPCSSRRAFAALEARSATARGSPRFPQPDGTVKTSAAWLIEHAGFTRGLRRSAPPSRSRASTRSRSPTAGAGTTEQLVALAREIADGVRARFGVELEPEPVFVGHSWV